MYAAMPNDQGSATGDEALLARAAWLYYNDGLTQGEVGEELNLSRIKVSRLLESGRASGLSKFASTPDTMAASSSRPSSPGASASTTCASYPRSTAATSMSALARPATAQYLMAELRPGQLLAVGWGQTVSISIRMLGYVAKERGIGLVTLTGGVRTYVDGMRTANWDRNVHVIPAPLLVSDPALATALHGEPSVAGLMEMALAADFKLVGVGGLDPGATVVTQGYISPAEVSRSGGVAPSGTSSASSSIARGISSTCRCTAKSSGSTSSGFAPRKR